MRALVVAGLVLAGACSPGPRDVAGEGSDVRVVTPPEGAPDGGAPTDTYAHVAKRAHGVVALAEARHLREADARAFVDHLADELDACAARLEERGELVDGAARVVAIAGPRGTAEGLNVRLAPGGAVAQNALMCVLAPLRAAPFPASNDGAAPGVAVEVTWQPIGGGAGQRSRSGKLQLDQSASDAGTPLP